MIKIKYIWLLYLIGIVSYAVANECELVIPEVVVPNTVVTLSAKCNDTSVNSLPRTFSWSLDSSIASTPFSDSPEVKHKFLLPGHYPLILRIKSGASFSSLTEQLTVAWPRSGQPEHSSSMTLDSNLNRIWVVNTDNASVTAIDALTKQKLFITPVGQEPRNIAYSSGIIYVTCQKSHELIVLNAVDGRIKHRIPLPRASQPFGILLSADRKYAYVSLQSTGEIAEIDLSTNTLSRQLSVNKHPRAMAMSSDGKKLFVTQYISEKDSGIVTVVDLQNWKFVRNIGLKNNPGPDTESSSRGIPNALDGILISPDGKTLWVCGKKDNTSAGLFSGNMKDENKIALTFETTVRSIVMRIPLDTYKEDPLKRADVDNRGLPAALAVTMQGDYLFVATLSSNAIDILDAFSFVKVASIEPPSAIDSLSASNELAPKGLLLLPNGRLWVHYFMSREVAVYKIDEVSQSSTFDREALIVTIESETLSKQVLQGKKIFYNSADDRMAKDNYISCVVCHLDGGGTDGRVWDFTDRGEGLRRTPSLKGHNGVGQGPLHWSGNFDEVQDFEHDMRGPQRGTGFMSNAMFNQGTRNTSLGDKKAGMSPELDALAAYVTSLNEFPASPYRNSDGLMTVAAKHGETIFNSTKTGCAVCHIAPTFTDGRIKKISSLTDYLNSTVIPGNAKSFVTEQGFLLHDVGTIRTSSGRRLSKTALDSCLGVASVSHCIESLPLLPGFDTPTLEGLWDNTSFLHDGSAISLKEVITTRNQGDKHGVTSHLSESQRHDLISYLLQLGGDTQSDTSSSISSLAFSKKSRLEPRFIWNGKKWILSVNPGSSKPPVYLDVSGQRVLRNP